MRRPLAVLFLCALVPALALAQDVKDKTALDSQWKTLGKQIAERHFEMSKNIEKTEWKREAVEELALAILADPDHKHAREKLGYKKEGDVWRGYPQVPPPAATKLDPPLAERCSKLRDDSAKKIAALAKRAQKGGLELEARRLAGIALDFKHDEKTAREVLGHENRRGGWICPRELKVRAAFEKAIKEAGKGEEKPNDHDKEIEKLLDLDELARRETSHGVFLATKAAPGVDADAICKALEATWAAHRYFMLGDDKGFSVDGEPKRETTGPAPLKLPGFAPRWLVVDESQHDKYIDKVVAKESERKFNKGLGGTGVVAALSSGTQVLIYETRTRPAGREEWASAMMITHCHLPIIADGAHLPDFILEGLRRFYSGHVSGKADWWYISEGSTGNRAPFTPGTFEEFRGKTREVLTLSFPGDLNALLARGIGDMERLDSVKAYSFIDFLIARRRGELARFISELKKDEAPHKTLETALGKSIDEIEREWRDWAGEEY